MALSSSASSPKPFSAVPQVPGPPLIGHLEGLKTTNLRAFVTRCYQEYGPVFKIDVLGQSYVILAGPEANLFTMKEGHKVLRSLEAWRPNDLEMGVSRSMISVDGEEHRMFRKVESRTYSRSYFAAHLRQATAVVAEDLTALRSGDQLPVAQFSKEVVTEQLARLVVSGTARPYLKDMLKFVQTALMVRVSRQWPELVLKTPAYQRAKARIFKMVDELVQWHRQHPAQATGREPDMIDDVLGAQRHHPEHWGEADVRLAAMGAFIAGMDTAANSLAFMLYRLHKHPEFLPDIVAEADQLFAHGVPNASALGQAQHLHHFVMETLRLHPIAPAMNRTLSQEVVFGGFSLPEGTKVIIGQTTSHGLPELFSDPERFDPSRFAAERAEHRQPGAYAPFGLGAHTCAGSGMAEGLIMLNAAAIVRTLELELSPTYQLRQVARPTPSPDHRLWLRVRRVRYPTVSLLA